MAMGKALKFNEKSENRRKILKKKIISRFIEFPRLASANNNRRVICGNKKNFICGPSTIKYANLNELLSR